LQIARCSLRNGRARVFDLNQLLLLDINVLPGASEEFIDD
jgi:hypothetical protein